MNRPGWWRAAACAIAMAAAAASGGAARAGAAVDPDPDRVLVVSQPHDPSAAKTFVDLSAYVLRDLQDIPGMRPTAFAPDAQEVLAAVDAGRLARADLASPLSDAAMHRICAALGVARLLRLSATQTRQGIVGRAVFEVSDGVGWKPAYTYGPSAPQPAKSGILQVLYAMARDIAKGVVEHRRTPAAIPTITPVPEDPKAAAPVTAPGGAAPTVAAPKPETPTAPTPAPGARGGGAAAPGTPAPATPKPGTPTTPAAAAEPAAGSAEPTLGAGSALALVLGKYREKRDTANVIVTLRRAVDESPRDASLRRQLAEAYLQRGLSAAARDESVRAVALSPDDASLHRLLGDSMMDAGEVDGAVAEYRSAVRLGAGDPANHIALGDACWNAGKSDEAVKCYEAAVKADASSAIAQRRLARTHLLNNRYAECLTAMKAAHAHATRENAAAYASDYVALVQSIETALRDGMAALQRGRKDFVATTRTREQVFQEASGVRKRASEIADLLGDLPSPDGYDGAQAQYGQSAALASQAADSFMVYLETQAEISDQQATLLRMEALRQLDGAADRLKRLTTTKPSR